MVVVARLGLTLAQNVQLLLALAELRHHDERLINRFDYDGDYGTVLNRHVFETLAYNARIALHVRVHYGRDPHHITEAQYKAVARALRQAVEPDPRVAGVPSTKGTL